MTSISIQEYINCITLTNEDLYDKILDYKLSSEQLLDSGFPIPDPNHPDKIILCSDSVFSSSQDPAKQICRCGKTVSLLDENWYKDEDGCSYHTGKRVFCDGPGNGLFSCCKSVSGENGCVQHKYHVSSFKPAEESLFIKTFHKNHDLPKYFNVFALDCEMAYTTAGLEVVEVSIVSMVGEVVYHTFVRPDNPILDFNTAFSGVSPEDLEGGTTLADVQDYLLHLLDDDSILIGHGLENDMLGLRLVHANVVDTSIVFTHERGYPMRHSLKTLASKYLNKTIHVDLCGHNSIEDAKISLELMLHKVSVDMMAYPFLTPNFTDNCDFLVPPAPSRCTKMYCITSMSMPVCLPNYLNNSYKRRSYSSKKHQANHPKCVRFETPMFPVVTGCTNSYQHQPTGQLVGGYETELDLQLAQNASV